MQAWTRSRGRASSRSTWPETHDLDIETLDALADLADGLAAAGAELRLASVRVPARELLDRSGITARVRLHPTLGATATAWAGQNDNMLNEIRAVLTTTPERWLRLVETLPEELLERAPEPGEWSAADCLRHMLAGERNVYGVLLAQFMEDATPLPAADPDAARRPIAETAVAFARLRGEHIACIAGLTPADLDRTLQHPGLGDITLGQLLSGCCAHDLQHAVQAELALMQAFIPASGIWRGVFADHDVEALAAG